MNSVDPSASRQATRPLAQPETVVSVEGAVAEYRDHTILHDLSLQIQRGGFAHLVGSLGLREDDFAPTSLPGS